MKLNSLKDRLLKMCRDKANRPIGEYSCPADFVLKNGHDFKTMIPRPHFLKKRKMGDCYQNTIFAATYIECCNLTALFPDSYLDKIHQRLMNRPSGKEFLLSRHGRENDFLRKYLGEYYHCEGYAILGKDACLHAWLVNKDFEVIDPTWRDGKGYYGVVFKNRYFIHTLSYGLIDNPREDYPILRMPNEELLKHIIIPEDSKK